jgi:hypothetical protein
MKPILTAKRPKKTWHAVSVAVKAGGCVVREPIGAEPNSISS